MIRLITRIAAVCLLALAGCGDGGEPVRYTASEPAPAARVSVPVRSIALREVSLPTHAAEEGISVADSSGAITASADRIWADDPTRAVTLRLTNSLADLTGRVVASDPWPLRETPDVVVEVRMEEFVAQASGRFVATGRYYVAYEEGLGSDRAISFRLAETYDTDSGFAGIAGARSRIIAALARDIARRGLR
ncbi:MAG: PqiC family protein [Silicimonas sp.]|jgi:hypothetical protein|nr:PqiC family protein [Silicimonas sp.]